MARESCAARGVPQVADEASLTAGRWLLQAAL